MDNQVTLQVALTSINNVSQLLKDNEQYEIDNSILYNEYDQENYEQEPKYNNDVEMNKTGDDWDDNTYLNW